MSLAWRFDLLAGALRRVLRINEQTDASFEQEAYSNPFKACQLYSESFAIMQIIIIIIM